MATPSVLLATTALVGSVLHAGDQELPIKPPRGWVEISAGIYKLENLGQAREQARAALIGGRQPWRLEPANIAAECLQAFGIEGPQDLIAFGVMLQPARAISTFQLKKPRSIYTVHIDNQFKVPIATELVVSKR